MKTCTQCHIEKDESNYHKNKSRKDGFTEVCKECCKINGKNYYEKNKEEFSIKAKAKYAENPEPAKLRAREYLENNREECNAKSLAYHFAHRDERLISMAEYAEANREFRIEYDKNYYIENAEIIKARVNVYYKANAEEINAKTRADRKENPEKFREYDRLQYIANPERFLIKDVNRRARKKGNGGKLSPGLKKKLFKLQRGHCAICKIKLSDAPRQQHMDHTIALANGGPNEDWNMQLLCQPCNNQKHTKDNLEFMQSKGYLI